MRNHLGRKITLLVEIVGFSIIFIACAVGSISSDGSNSGLSMSTGSKTFNSKSSSAEDTLKIPTPINAHPNIVINNPSREPAFYSPSGGENHAWMSYFAVNIDHPYAYFGDNVYIDVTAYNNDAGVLGANLYVKYIYKDKNGVVTLTESSAEHNVPRGNSYAFPRVTKTLGGSTLPWTGGSAMDRINVELWWDSSGTQRLQQDGPYAQLPVLAHLYFQGVGGHEIDTNGDTLYDGVQCESMIWTNGGSTPVTVKGYLHDMYDSQHDSASQDFTINDNQNTWLFGPDLHVQNGGPTGQYHYYMEVYDKYTGLLEATTANQYISPLYRPDYTVSWTINSNPQELIIRIDGLDNTVPVTCPWKVASTHTLYAASPQSKGETGIRYVWTSWSDGGAQSHTVGPIPNSNGQYTANFKTQYYLTVSSAYDSPYPTGGWFDSGTNINAYVNSPVAGPTGTQYVCTGWSGSGSVPSSGTGSSVSFTISASSSITWNWKTQYYLTVSSAYGTTGGQGWYDSGTNAYATVTPLTMPGGSGTQYVFTQWSGDASGSTSPSNPIYMNGPKTANANWKTQYQHTITSSPVTGSGCVTVDGGGVTTPYTTPWWDSGSSHTIAAISLVAIVPGQSQYAYSSWSDSGAQSHSISPTSVTTYTASFQLQYYFSVSSAYDSPTGQGWYNSGSFVIGSTVTRPVSGGVGIQYETTGWTGTGSLSSGGSSGLSSTYSFTINAYSTCTWNWKTQYYLTVSSAYATPGGAGWYDAGSTTYATLSSGTVSGGASTQYVFTSWGTDASGTNYAQSNLITMNGPKTATANWKAQYYLTVSSAYGSTGGQGWYDSGTNAYATVTPLTVSGGSGIQYVFTQWSGDASGSTSPSNAIVMSGPKTATANWKTQYQHTITSGPTGSGYVAVDGSPVTTPYTTPWWDSGSSHAIAANSPVTMVLGQSQYRYSSWSDSGAQSHSISPTSVTTYTAYFQPQYYFSVSSAYDSPTGQGWYDSGSSVVSTVTRPVSGGTGVQYETTGWTGTGSLSSGGGSGSSSTYSFTINAYSTCTWNWKTQYYLTVNSVFDAPIPTSDWFDSGTNVTGSVSSIVAGPSGTQYVCTGWSGSGSVPSSGSGASVIFTINSPSSIAWNWKAQYYLTVSSAYGSTGGQGWYDSGTNAYATVTPLTVSGGSGIQYVFTQWSGDASGSTSPSNAINMNGPKTANANWKAQYYLGVSTNPPSLSPPPVVSPVGDNFWYDGGTLVTCEAQVVIGCDFGNWTVDGMNQGSGVNPITVAMDGPHNAIANYTVVFVHDIAVVGVSHSKSVVCQGYCANVSVTVENQGNYSESFNVTIYADSMPIASQNMTLMSGDSNIIVTVWNTTGFAKGNYTISACASALANEANITNNNCPGGWLMVSIVGDLSGGTPNPWDFVPDGRVSSVDVSVVSRCFGSYPGCSPPMIWQPNCDINNNGRIDGEDVAIVAKHFGEADP